MNLPAGMQSRIFGDEHVLTMPVKTHNLDDRLQESKMIVQKAIIDYNPYAVCLMLSGGDDSITALLVALMLGVRIDFIIHGVTGTGLKDVRKYVHRVAAITGIKIIEADAGNAFEDYVQRKGFFGVGKTAHSFSYHVLKADPFRKAVSKHIRKGKEGRNIILINGVRVEESELRADNYGDNPYRQDPASPNNIWVNIIHWFTKKECLHLLDAEKFERSPVAIHLGRSGECNCGTMQDEAGRIACAQYDPEWGQWMKAIRKYAIAKWGWDISQNPNKKRMQEIREEVSKLEAYQPMCVGCKSQQLKLTVFDKQDLTSQKNALSDVPLSNTDENCDMAGNIADNNEACSHRI